MKTFMLLLAFTVTNPEGSTLDETIHVLSRHFDEKIECETFIKDWDDTIRIRGPEKVAELLKDDYTVELTDVRCTPAPPEPVATERNE